MILTKDYVLVNEICKREGIAMSNFSPLANDDMLIETEAVIKVGATTVINKSSSVLPKYIRELANKHTYTNLEGLMILNELKEEYYLEMSKIKRIGEIVDVEDKKFVRLSEDLMSIFSNPKLVIYPIDKSEIEQPFMKDIIEKKQFKQIDKSTFLTWY